MSTSTPRQMETDDGSNQQRAFHTNRLSKGAYIQVMDSRSLLQKRFPELALARRQVDK
jgi:hypothetical protein